MPIKRAPNKPAFYRQRKKSILFEEGGKFDKLLKFFMEEKKTKKKEVSKKKKSLSKVKEQRFHNVEHRIQRAINSAPKKKVPDKRAPHFWKVMIKYIDKNLSKSLLEFQGRWNDSLEEEVIKRHEGGCYTNRSRR